MFVCYIDKVEPVAVCSCMCRVCRHMMCVHYSDKGAPGPMKITLIHLPQCMKMFARTRARTLLAVQGGERSEEGVSGTGGS